jgi:myo-inositol-1(or 4)-monophosphatase
LTSTFIELSDLARGLFAGLRLPLDHESKGGSAFDPVTSLDRDIEQAMRAFLLGRFPDHGVWGEEAGWSNAGAARHWSLDPVDGTRALICGLPSWCVLVGLIDGGQHVAGMIDCPSLDERLIGLDGATTRNGVRASTSGCSAVAGARLSTTDPYLFEGRDAAAFAVLRGAVLLTRYGLDALAYARVATGDLDLVVESGLKRHDLDALVPVVRGAGGHVGDWSGGEDWDSGRIVAAASKALYDEAVALLSR